MLAKKNRTGSAALVLLLVLTVFLAGCTPPGPRALLKGKKLLDRGDYAGAVEQFKTATSLLPTNAQAWNYLGVACQRAGQPADAASAYQRALTLDRDLVEAHYNLGSLWLEQDKPAAARTEFTAYTLRRSNEPDGWLKLGLAQLHSNDLLSSEKSFSTALHLSTNNAEALNGLGLARAKRGRAADAVQFFTAAIRYHPEFAPAYLNLATIAQEDLHDNKLALENYQAYLALTPAAGRLGRRQPNRKEPGTAAVGRRCCSEDDRPTPASRRQVNRNNRVETAADHSFSCAAKTGNNHTPGGDSSFAQCFCPAAR